MITGNINNLISWLNDNGIDEWQLSTSSNRQGNSYIFKSEDDIPREQEIERMTRQLAYSQNSIIYVFGKKKGKSNVGNFTETWVNSGNGAAPSAAQVISGMPALSQADIDARIETAIMKERLAWQQREVERERKEIAEMKKEYEKEKESVLGILIDKAAPVISGLLSRRTPQVAIAGTDGDVSVPRVIPVGTDGKKGQTNATEETLADTGAFTDDEADELYSLMSRYKAVDPDYMTLIRRFVSFAESGEEITVGGIVKLNYTQIKEMLL